MPALLNALLRSAGFSASEAPPESKAGKLRTVLQNIAESSEFEYLECSHYKDMCAKQLEDLYSSVFIALEDVDMPIFKAARRKIDHFAFGSCAHPAYARRSSPRLHVLSQGSKRQFCESDGAESLFSQNMRSSQGSTSSLTMGPLTADTNLTALPFPPSKKHDGTRRVLHPQNLLRWPDPSKIVELPVKVVAGIEKLKHAKLPFSFKNDNWVSLMDHTFMWMLHVQGTVSFGIPLRERVHRLILSSVQSLGNPALMAVINKDWTVNKFTDQLNYRTHPPAASKGQQRATMHRYGKVAKTPYTMPLIDANILVWDGVSEKTLEESALKPGHSGYEELPFVTSAVSTAQQPVADQMDFSSARSSAVTAQGHPAPLPASMPPPTGPCAAGSQRPIAQAFPWTNMHNGGMWQLAEDQGTGQTVQPGMFAVSLEHQAGLIGTRAGTIGETQWALMAPPDIGPQERSQPFPRGARTGGTAPGGAKVPKRGAAKGEEGSAAPPRCKPKPKPFSTHVKQALHTLLHTKTDPMLKVMEEEEEIVVEELCRLGAPYLVASIFSDGKNGFSYYVGKPVAQHGGKLICWYPPSASSTSGFGTFESAGIFDQVEDLALAPTFIMKIHREDVSTPIPCHSEVAEDAAKDYTQEGKACQSKKGVLAKDNLAWLKAMFTKPGVELSQKQLLGKLPKVIINDPEVRDALGQCITPA